jgi:hypothetical protein
VEALLNVLPLNIEYPGEWWIQIITEVLDLLDEED